ncbi:hypothetical protein CYMTET_11831 [Cymbomonas tetramitiformis]|uniref:ACT domain-containing protein n=1 Tax=Cymbomonas tetramitiformis TaxID=36881 RepID=A0AAE0LCN5_9CHLO|nr:hypothetical protein CYMTET_11831 [Cymbomonas tetramitiformis]
MLSILLSEAKSSEVAAIPEPPRIRIEAETDYVLERVICGENETCGNVRVDNYSDDDYTIAIVDSEIIPGSLLEMVQLFTELKLQIVRARITSDGLYFVDEFHLTDHKNKKVHDPEKLEQISQLLTKLTSKVKTVGAVKTPALEVVTIFELVGSKQLSLVSEITTLILWHSCTIDTLTVSSSANTIGLIVTVQEHDRPVDEEKAQLLLLKLQECVGGDVVIKMYQKAKSDVHAERRLHELMIGNKECIPTTPSRRALRGDSSSPTNPCNLDSPAPSRVWSGRRKTKSDSDLIFAETEAEVEADYDSVMEYILVNIWCTERQSLFFDVLCTTSTLGYDVIHATVNAEGSSTHLELFLRQVNFNTLTEANRVPSQQELVILEETLLSSVQRLKGTRMDVCCQDRPGLLGHITRTLREHQLSVSAAAVRLEKEDDTCPSKTVVNIFYITTESGETPDHTKMKEICELVGGELVDLTRERQGSISSVSGSSDDNGPIQSSATSASMSVPRTSPLKSLKEDPDGAGLEGFNGSGKGRSRTISLSLRHGAHGSCEQLHQYLACRGSSFKPGSSVSKLSHSMSVRNPAAPEEVQPARDRGRTINPNDKKFQISDIRKAHLMGKDGCMGSLVDRDVGSRRTRRGESEQVSVVKRLSQTGSGKGESMTAAAKSAEFEHHIRQWKEMEHSLREIFISGNGPNQLSPVFSPPAHG